jgi:hypothetical protein
MPQEFDEVIARLPAFGYLYYDVREQTLYEADAIPFEIVDKVENPPIPKE